MRRMQWWMILGLPAAGLLAALLGQSVLGQPDKKASGPQPNALLVVLPEPQTVIDVGSKPTDQPKGSESPKPISEFPPGLPLEKPAAPTMVITQPTNPALPAQLNPARIQVEPSQALSTQKIDLPGLPMASSVVGSGKQQPALTIEWTGPPTIRVNQKLPAQFHVKNTSTTTVENVVVRHRLGQGVTVKFSEPQAVNDGGELVWQLGTLAPEQTRRIELHLESSTRGPLNCQASVTFTAVAAHQVQVREPQLVVKVRAPEKIVAGENVTLLYAISNPGDGITEAVKVKTILPDGVEHARGKVVELDVGSLAPKEIRTMQLVCQAMGQGTQKCVVVATGDGSLNSEDTCKFEILMPSLNVAMSGPKLRYLDRPATYTLKVTNPGSAPANQVEVQELIPTGFKFHQASNDGRFQESTRLVTWNLGELQPGQAKEVTVNLVPIETGEHRLLAMAKATRGLKSEAEVRTQVEGLPSLAIEVGHVDDPIEVGAETAFEIRLVNTGTKTETNVQIICTIPEQLEFKGARCSTTLGCRQEGRELIFEPLARLAPKADVIYRVQVRGIAAGDVRFRTCIRADGLKDPVLRDQSMRIYSDDGLSVPTAAPSSLPPVPPPVGLPGPTPTPAPVSAQPIAPAPIPSFVPNGSASPSPGNVLLPAPKFDPIVPPPSPPSNGPVTTGSWSLGDRIAPPVATPLPAPTLPPHALPIPKGNS